ncbi:MAG: hypothetical protein Q4F34_02520 [Prevotellaceae bacterium]|nr:hypothetical protein [Prevotellaceae bacterium]
MKKIYQKPNSEAIKLCFESAINDGSPTFGDKVTDGTQLGKEDEDGYFGW